MKVSDIFEKPWGFAMILVLMVGGYISAYCVLFRFPHGYIEMKPEQKPHVEQFSAGDIHITDLRSGTEFNRIITFPNGRTVVEGGYINSWGEQRIRVIGGSQPDP